MNKLRIYESYVSQIGIYMPLSANVDIILMILGLKPAIRTKIKESNNFKYIDNWSKKWGYFSYMDQEEYIYIAPDDQLAHQMIQLDHMAQKKEDLFGILLGYPNCCTKKIKKIGEELIDKYESNLCQKKFEAFFELINPKDYRIGTAFISHVPCSTRCFDSLLIAQKLGFFILKNKKKPVLQGWVNALEKIYKGNLCLHQL